MKIFTLIKKHWAVLSYLFFGGCTTLVNFVVYYVANNLLCLSNIVSTSVAWVISVLFAYLTNKNFVFHSAAIGKVEKIRELFKFMSCRLFTGAMDTAIMYVAVDRLDGSGLAWKLLSNIIVIVVNYVLSKVVVFKKQNTEHK